MDSLSSYIYAKDPTFYGGQQEDYLKRAEMAICKGVSMIKTAASSAAPLSHTFFTVQRALSRERHKIAQDHGTDKKECFGTSRAAKLGSSANCQYTLSDTPLGGPAYKVYNAKARTSLANTLKTRMNHSPKTIDKSQATVETTMNGQKTTQSIRVFEGPDIGRLRWAEPISPKEFQTALELATPPSDPDEILKDYENAKSLREKTPALFERLVMFLAIRGIEDVLSYILEGRKMRPALVISELGMEVEGKQIPLGKHFTFLIQDNKTCPVERMAQEAIVTVMHQDHFCIEETMEVISKVFEKALLWDKNTQSLDELKDLVATIRFLYAWCMPNLRGDGAIGDWLEIAIYRYHGFTKTTHNQNTLPCFEPLASTSFKEYRESYNETISIE